MPDPVIAAQRRYIEEIVEQTGLSRTRVAQLARLAPSTLNRLFQPNATHALSARSLAKLAGASSVPITGAVAAKIVGMIDRELLWRAFQLAREKVPRGLFGRRHWRTLVEVQALAYDFLVERR